MHFVWDERKNAVNKRKHKVSFEAAVFAFEDPLALSMVDGRYQEERWVTLGRSGCCTSGFRGSQ
jgi:hypothetical protein